MRLRNIRTFRCVKKKGYGYVYDPDGPFVEWRHVRDLLEAHNALLRKHNELKRYLTDYIRRDT